MARPKMHPESVYKTTLYLDREVMRDIRRLFPGYDTSTIVRDMMKRVVKSRADKLQVPLANAPSDPDDVRFEV